MRPLQDREEDGSVAFWRSGADGTLRIQRCLSCGNFMHPPDVLCTRCGGESLDFEAVSGEGQLYSFTTYYNVREGEIAPTIGVVELTEQAGLLLPCDLSAVDDPEALRIGTPMRVWFENPLGDFYIPQFAPIG